MPPEVFSEADYRALGLKVGAKPAEIKRAYRILAKKWHPDHYHSESYEARATAEEKFREIHEAYERLLENWWKVAEQLAKAKAAPAAGQEEAKTSDERAEPEKSYSTGIHRKAQAFRAAKFFFVAAVLAILLYQAGSVYWYSSDEMVTAPPRWDQKAPEGPDPAPRPPEAEPSLDKLLSDILPPPAPPSSLLQPPADAAKKYFTIGSSPSEVLRVQGKPSRVQGQIWIYGLSEIQFKQGLVWRFNNFDGNLRVRMLPQNSGENPAPSHFTVGSTEDEVLLVQGTPTRIEQGKWFYGFSEIRFKEHRVKEYDNYFGSLKVRLLPSSHIGFSPQKYFFTLGSGPDEVLAVQGTPTSIQGNAWSYNFSYVYFRDGKVNSVSDSDGSLRFIPPEDIPDSAVNRSAIDSGS